MSEITFKDLMKKPDAQEQAIAGERLMEIAKELETEEHFSRQTVFEGMLDALLRLAHIHDDERYFQKTNDTRRLLLLAKQRIDHAFDSFPNYRAQRICDETYGKDSLWLRDSKNFEPPENQH
jgi:hypothetical protein